MSELPCTIRSPMTIDIDREYRARIQAMTIVERIQRAEALFIWSRDYVARSILAAKGPMSDDELKYEMALRLYGSDPETRALIEEWRGRAGR
jgi:hypothetical protein